MFSVEQLKKATIIFNNGKKGDKVGLKCKCGGEFVIREGYSKFCGCSNYPCCNEKLGIVNTNRVYLSDVSRIAMADYECPETIGSNWEDDMEYYYE